MKKFIAVALTAVMLVGAMSGCSGGGKSSSSDTSGEKSSSSTTDSSNDSGEVIENFNMEGYPIVNEKVTVKMMGAKSGIHGPWDQMVFFKTLEEKTNVTFEFDTPAADVFEEKKNLAFTSGDYPEVFFGGNLSKQQEVKYGSQGILIPLEEYIEKYCPNITQMFNDNPEYRRSVTAPDGHIYALPNILDLSIAVAGAMWMNREWLDELGVAPEDLPTTAEGFTELLMRMKDEDPNKNGEKDEIPFSMADPSGGPIFNFVPAFGMTTREFYVDNDVIKYGYTQPNFKEFLTWANDLWTKGLVDSEGFTQTGNDVTAKGTDNKIGAAFHAIPQLVYGMTDPEIAAKYPIAPAMSSKVSPEPLYSRGTGITTGTFAITDKCENIEVMMRWVDYLYTEEGAFFAHYGPENDLWKINDDGKKEYIVPTDGKNIEEHRGNDITPDCGLAIPKWYRNDFYANWNDALEEQRQKQTDEKLMPYAKVALPDMYFTEEEQGELDILTTDINKFTSENAAKFITGDKKLDEYDSFIETLNKMKVDRVITIYQQAYDRWKSQ